MFRFLVPLALLAAVSACAAGGPQTEAAAWCAGNTSGAMAQACVANAAEDHAECTKPAQSRAATGGAGGYATPTTNSDPGYYGRCRREELTMRRVTGRPTGPVVMVDCALPGGSKMLMNKSACVERGGTPAG